MKNNKDSFAKNVADINRLEELYYIQGYIKCLKTRGSQANLIESPIISVRPQQLDNKQSIPDAIIEVDGSKDWTEITTFSRSQEMRNNIGIHRKNYNAYTKPHIIQGLSISQFALLGIGFLHALSKKVDKNYSRFAAISENPPLGHLIVALVNDDPFLEEDHFNNLVNYLKDEHVLESSNVARSYFKVIIIAAFVRCPDSIWKLKFATIANEQVLSRIRERQIRKSLLLQQLNKTLQEKVLS